MITVYFFKTYPYIFSKILHMYLFEKTSKTEIIQTESFISQFITNYFKLNGKYHGDMIKKSNVFNINTKTHIEEIVSTHYFYNKRHGKYNVISTQNNKTFTEVSKIIYKNGKFYWSDTKKIIVTHK